MVCYALGRAKEVNPELTAAIALGNKEFAVDSRNSIVLFNLGLYNLSFGNKEEATNLYQRGLSMEPSRFAIEEALEDLRDAELLSSADSHPIQDLLTNAAVAA
jgi:tetratricopeptide (TPR) repeat protein